MKIIRSSKFIIFVIVMVSLLAIPLVIVYAINRVAVDDNPVLEPGNPRCSDIGSFEYSFKIDDWDVGDKNGTHVDRNTSVVFTILNSDGTYFDWNATTPISAVIVKGGPNAHVWYYNPGALADSRLYSPPAGGGGTAEVSHVVFCWDGTPTPTETIETPTATVETPTATIETPTATVETPSPTPTDEEKEDTPTPTPMVETPTATIETPTATVETPSPTPTDEEKEDTPTPTPTEPKTVITPTFTPTPTVETPTPTPTDEEKEDTPTPTPTATVETPTPTPTDEEKDDTPTPTPTATVETPTPTPTATDEPSGGIEVIQGTSIWDMVIQWLCRIGINIGGCRP